MTRERGLQAGSLVPLSVYSEPESSHSLPQFGISPTKKHKTVMKNIKPSLRLTSHRIHGGTDIIFGTEKAKPVTLRTFSLSVYPELVYSFPLTLRIFLSEFQSSAIRAY